MAFRHALSGLALVLMLPVALAAQAPNVVLVSLDTFRADRLAAWGGSPGLAPNLNALALKGTAFTITESSGLSPPGGGPSHGLGGTGGGDDAFPVQPPEHLEGLPLHLVFLAADVGDGVVQDVQGRNAGVARTGDGLHGKGENAQESEAIHERLEGHGHPRAGAIGAGHDGADPPPLSLLDGQEGRVVGVHFGQEDGHVAFLAENRGVGTDQGA